MRFYCHVLTSLCGVVSSLNVFPCWPFYHVIGFLNSNPFPLNQRYPFPLNHARAILLIIVYWMAYHYLMLFDHGRLVASPHRVIMSLITDKSLSH